MLLLPTEESAGAAQPGAYTRQVERPGITAARTHPPASVALVALREHSVI
jgi:hypothetical protein